MERLRGRAVRVLASASLACVLGGGCTSDCGYSNSLSLNEFGEGLLAIGTLVGIGAGVCALSEEGGGGNMHYLWASEADYSYYDPWR